MDTEGETVLYKARCAAGHEWDVYAQEQGDRVRVPERDLRCPTCRPERRAVELNEPENLT